MPKLTNRNPKYAKHKASGQACVSLGGRCVYLGVYGSRVSRDTYDRVVSEWLANGRRTHSREARRGTMTELLAAFWTHAESYYKSASGHRGELGSYRLAVAAVRALFSESLAEDFGPLALKSVRDHMVSLGWSRGYINRQIGRVKQIFKWGTENEIVPGSVYQSLLAVSGLRQGKTEAKDTAPIKPVPVAFVNDTLDHCSPQIGAMIRLQMLTGMRPGEVCRLRGCDIDTTGPLWVYRLALHKTAHHGHTRAVYMGGRCQEIIKPFLKPDVQAFLFTPAEVLQWHRDRRTEARQTPAGQGNRVGSNRVKRRKLRRSISQRYTTGSYHRAIRSACDLAYPPPEPLGQRENETRAAWKARLSSDQKIDLWKWRREHRWHPHQLRHNFATEIRRERGLEVAQVLLGHKSMDVTQVYAEADVVKAMAVMQEVG